MERNYLMQSTHAPRWTARALSVLLWIAGSAYLVRNELSLPTPDWVVICTMPLIWAAVIALPILGHHAWKRGEYTACLLLTLAAVVGSIFTLQGTISRQSEARDVKVAEAQASNFTRGELLDELSRAKVREADATKYGDAEMKGEKCGPRCQDWRLRAKEVKAHIDQLTAQIAAIGASKPVASGEKRIAAAISMLPFVTAQPAKIEEAVALFNPSLFGLFLELAALATAFFGWRPAEFKQATAAPEKAVQAETPRGRTHLDEIIRDWQQQADLHVPETMPSTELFSGEQPDPTKPRKSKKRSDRKDRVIAKIRAQTLAGKRPSLKLVTARYRLPKATAHRYMVAANAEAKRALN
jgi:hypothetical protein